MGELEWRDDNLPVSTRFDDPYYSRQDGRAETSHVFVAGNNLPRRWPKMSKCTIAELGFGTGLNFLETVHQWRLAKLQGACLEFISFELYPLDREDIARALSVWPELKGDVDRLIDIWNPANRQLEVAFADNVFLRVFFGDANHLLRELEFRADAWYLDGFSPAKNPELWNEELMNQVAIHTVAGGTLATYSSAGHVRRKLQSAGFNVTKTGGFGSKREMLTGQMPNDIPVADRP